MNGLHLTMNTQLVLIDTWWNVNLQKSSSELPIYRFNRYMVECEYGIGRDVVVYQLVLIDTFHHVSIKTKQCYSHSISTTMIHIKCQRWF